MTFQHICPGDRCAICKWERERPARAIRRAKVQAEQNRKTKRIPWVFLEEKELRARGESGRLRASADAINVSDKPPRPALSEAAKEPRRTAQRTSLSYPTRFNHTHKNCGNRSHERRGA